MKKGIYLRPGCLDDCLLPIQASIFDKLLVSTRLHGGEPWLGTTEPWNSRLIYTSYKHQRFPCMWYRIQRSIYTEIDIYRHGIPRLYPYRHNTPYDGLVGGPRKILPLRPNSIIPRLHPSFPALFCLCMHLSSVHVGI